MELGFQLRILGRLTIQICNKLLVRFLKFNTQTQFLLVIFSGSNQLTLSVFYLLLQLTRLFLQPSMSLLLLLERGRCLSQALLGFLVAKTKRFKTCFQFRMLGKLKRQFSIVF